MVNYFLRTPRLRFRSWSEGDLALAMELWGDDRVSALIGGPFSADAVRARLEHEIALKREAGVQYWPIFLLEGGAFAGCAGLRPRPGEKRVYEVGFHLLPSHWGRGLATEAARGVIGYAFDALVAASLMAGHHPENERSRRVLLRLGFERCGEEFYPPSGLMEPIYRLGKAAAARIL
jgi:RimJ/RimL family protein N-acetyltransferase